MRRCMDREYGIACANGTAALEVALRALGVGPGDEVIVPPYTFIATATAPMLIGATPVFCDVDLATLNLDPARLEEAITPRTKAIVPVHFAGLAADMDAIGQALRRDHGIAVIEDAAHAHGGTWNGRPLGSIGSAATFSFQASKNMTAGEGGLITTNDPAMAEMCESLVWVGRKIGRPWYEHHRLGWNYRLTEFQAALLIAQLERLEEQTARRRAMLNTSPRDYGKCPAFSPSDVRRMRPGMHGTSMSFGSMQRCLVYREEMFLKGAHGRRNSGIQRLCASAIPKSNVSSIRRLQLIIRATQTCVRQASRRATRRYGWSIGCCSVMKRTWMTLRAQWSASTRIARSWDEVCLFLVSRCAAVWSAPLKVGEFRAEVRHTFGVSEWVAFQ